jgi:monoamine oxidase
MSTFEADVCVIGGGVAGLTAAERINSAGLTSVLIEAKDALGGRIRTQFPGSTGEGLPVELGAEFVHGLHPALHQYCQSQGLAMTEVEGRTYRNSGRGFEPFGESDGDDVGGLLRSPRLGEKDQTFENYLEQSSEPPDMKALARSYVEGFNAAEATRISTRALLRQQEAEDRIEGDRAWRIDSGYSSLITTLESHLSPLTSVLTGSRVKRVVWKRGSVETEARTRDGEALRVRSRAVIVTLPIGVLQNKNAESVVMFDPEPPAVRMMPLIAMGLAVRINLLFRDPFWEAVTPNPGFLLSNEDHFPTWWTRTNGQHHLMTGWTGGTRAFTLPFTSKDQLLEIAIEKLAKLFKRDKQELRNKLDGVYYHDWCSDPYSCGSYSYVTAGGYDSSQQIAEPIEQTLWFAGEAASIGYWGTVHGAMVSGKKAATDVITQLLGG